jgi:MarR family transcriptional regulator, 2-MHQ and catechol-resistance regulon repressor
MPKHQDLIDHIFDSLTSVEVETITNLLEKVKNRAEA